MTNQPQRDVRILLVEDDPTNQEVALRCLQHLGYRSVEVAADGRQALTALALRDFDLVLMDCHLPGMDGYQTSREIRNRASAVRDHAIAIVALTAAAMDGDRQKCFAAGMNGYLPKPLRFQALRQAIEQWSGSGTAASAPPTGDRPPTTSSTAPFDRDEFTGSVMGSEDLARRIVRGFVEDMPRQIARLAQAVSDGDAGRVTLLAHSIKGAAASLSSYEMRQASEILERQGRTGNLTAASPAVEELSASFDRARAAMERFCQEQRED
ncbi:MAG TPA: response regulator [Bryobacteraceae bacterium]|jgi:CheY-like chemotaxis protein/HPt (histidine-containing phosphotransfer) domain-containing protein|nr:response regulator [Bryobacteraceae bacterium]